MSLKNIINFLLTSVFAFVFSLSFVSEKAQAQFNAYANAGVNYGGGAGYGGYGGGGGLWGSGYSGGQQGCGYPWKQGSGATSMSDEEKEERRAISDLKKDLKARQLEKKRAETEMQFAARKLERQFDGEILDFLLETHIEKGNTCNDYVTAPNLNCNAQTGSTAVATGSVSVDSETGQQIVTTNADASFDCASKDDVPEKLRANWNNKYCAAKNKSDGGKVYPAICADKTLKPDDRKSSSYSTTECGRQLADYRKFRIKRDEAQSKIERAEDEMRDREYAISDAKERAKIEREYRAKNQLEGECEECGSEDRDGGYQKPKRDWVSILGTIGVGLGLGYIGKKYDERNAEYSAQLGYPPAQGYPTAVSMGFPFILAGAYGAINGGSGIGGFGCASGMNGGGFPYGAGGGMGGPFGGAMGAYGPYGPGGAFGYPQGMFGSPWGGGMYPPGYGPGGFMAGPNGGWPYGYGNGFAVNGVVNGGIGAPMYGNQVGGFQMPGGFQQGGFQMPGFAVNGGFAANGGFPVPGGFQQGGFQQGGFAANGGFAAQGFQQQNPQLQLQILQAQQQQAQLQAQYYQQQVQAQQQQYQRQIQIQMQAQQVQQEIQNLQLRLQMLYTGAYSGSSSGGGYYGSGSLGGSIGIAAPSVGGATGGIQYGTATSTPPNFIPGGGAGYQQTYPQQTYPTYPSTGGAVTVPAPSGGGR